MPYCSLHRGALFYQRWIARVQSPIAQRRSVATHRQIPQQPRLVGFVADEGDDHAVEVEEEHEQVETELDE